MRAGSLPGSRVRSLRPEESEVGRACALRREALLLADELRQSSDDLSRMATAYVITGDWAYKKYFRDILDIRDGRKPRPRPLGRPYWDLVLAGEREPPRDGGPWVALPKK